MKTVFLIAMLAVGVNAASTSSYTGKGCIDLKTLLPAPCLAAQGGEMNEFESELKSVINRFSQESVSNTPDFILAEYLQSCLANFHIAINERDKWYGIAPEPGAVKCWDRLHQEKP